MKQILILLLFSLVIVADTEVSGIFLQNEWWSEKGSPYIITNDIVIGPNARLVIEPGVEVIIEKPKSIPEGIDQFDHLDSFTVSIRVLGAIHWRGRPLKPLSFKPRYSDGDKYTSWYGIILNSHRSDEITIEYTDISGAAQAVMVNKGMPFIRNCSFVRNSIGLKCIGGSTPRVVHSVFTENYLAAIRVDEANPYIYNSIIAFNRTNGVWSDNRSELVFENNCVYGNEGRNFRGCDPLYGVVVEENGGGDSVDFANNITEDPLFAGSVGEQLVVNKRLKELKESSLDAPDVEVQNLLEDMLSYTPQKNFELSRFSPCIDAGSKKKKFREPDGSLPDLGIWGGAEFLELRE